jgi:excisionase family DNA binding protein
MARSKGRDFKTLAEAAIELGVSASTLRSQVHNGRLRAELIGKTWIVTEAELDRYERESLGRPGRRAKAVTGPSRNCLE